MAGRQPGPNSSSGLEAVHVDGCFSEHRAELPCRAEADTLSHAIDTATKRRKSYVVCKLCVTADDEHGHAVNKLYLLSPEQPT
jgi:hypothetical protein